MLPQFQTDLQELSLMQNKWATQLNPLLLNPVVKGQLLANVELLTGSNTINHRLGRKLQGWVVVRKRAASDLFDTQDANQSPSLTLLLTASAPVSIDLYVF